MLDQRVLESLFTTHRRSWTEQQRAIYQEAPPIFVKNIDNRQQQLDDEDDLARWETETNDFWVRNRAVGYPI